MTLTGSRYPFTILVDGNDYVITNQLATWFGGQADADSGQDSGETASGINTIKNPNYLGCALPIDLNRPKGNPCHGSPLINYSSKVPWFAEVIVTNRDNGLTVSGKLIDLGPDAPPEAEGTIDLTQPWFTAIQGNLNKGRINVDIRIPNAVTLFGLPNAPQAPVSQPIVTQASDDGLQITGENFQT